jgi:hypothetical protein
VAENVGEEDVDVSVAAESEDSAAGAESKMGKRRAMAAQRRKEVQAVNKIARKLEEEAEELEMQAGLKRRKIEELKNELEEKGKF